MNLREALVSVMVCLAMVVISAPASAQCVTSGCKVNISVSDPAVVLNWCCRSDPGGQVIEIRLTPAGGGGPIAPFEVVVAAVNSGIDLNLVAVYNTTQQTAKVRVRGPVPGTGIGSIQSVLNRIGPQEISGPDLVWLTELRTSGNVGLPKAEWGEENIQIAVDQIGDPSDPTSSIEILGSLLADVNILWVDRLITNVSVAGDFEGNLTMESAGSIGSFRVGGAWTNRAVGPDGPEIRSNVIVPGNIGDVRARRFYSNFFGGRTVSNPVPMNVIHRLECFGTGPGDSFDSIITATGLRPVPGVMVPPEFRIASPYQAAVRLIEGISVPFRVLGETARTTSTGEAAGVWIGGSLQAGQTLSFENRFAGTLAIARSLAGTVNFAGGELAGQVVVNSDNVGGTWTGTVNVGSISITNPVQGKYPQLSASLGGGAIGLAPFRMHELDSVPPHNQLLINQGISQRAFTSGSYPVKVRHYGSVRYAGPNPAAHAAMTEESISIEKETVKDGRQYLVAMQGFAIVGVSVALNVGRNEIGIGVAPGAALPEPGIYRVKLKPRQVRSIFVEGDPEVVWPEVEGEQMYRFRIFRDCDNDGQDDAGQSPAPSCPADCAAIDFTGDGVKSPEDITAFLSVYFTTPTVCLDPLLPGAPCFGRSVDVDGNGVKAPNDIFRFLNYYFACP